MKPVIKLSGSWRRGVRYTPTKWICLAYVPAHNGMELAGFGATPTSAYESFCHQLKDVQAIAQGLPL